MRSALVLLAALACNAFGGSMVTQIELRPVFTAQQVEVRLGDVADIHSQDLQTIRELVALPLGRRPAAGTDAVIRRDVLERWVRLRLGLEKAVTDWRGAQETWVHTPDRLEAAGGHTAATLAGERSTGAEASRKPPRLVARGDWVSLRFRGVGVELETRAQVLQDGHAGERVRVRAWSASEPVFARVISASAVEAGL